MLICIFIVDTDFDRSVPRFPFTHRAELLTGGLCNNEDEVLMRASVISSPLYGFKRFKVIKLKNLTVFFAFLGCFVFSVMAQAQTQAQVPSQSPTVTVANAWARASVKGQSATGVFMNLKSTTHSQLVGVSTSVAKVSQVHQMIMDNNVMKMNALPNGLELKAGSWVELKPGGYHIMLSDLQKVLEKDSKIDLQLTFQDDSGKKTQMEVSVPVLTKSPADEAAQSSTMPKNSQDHQHH